MLFPLSDARSCKPGLAGGKAAALARQLELPVAQPPSLVLGTEVYRAFLAAGGVGVRLRMLLSRSDPARMRWEELWDLAQRIQALFFTAPLPEGLRERLRSDLPGVLGAPPWVARSSAVCEDSPEHSFAGLHASLFCDGLRELETAIVRVWSSLWSAPALTYRQAKGLGFDPDDAMAVLLQAQLPSTLSGILFTRAPSDSTLMEIEAVAGLNDALVSNRAQGERYRIDRRTSQLRSWHPPGGQAENGKAKPLLSDSQLQALIRMGRDLEAAEGTPRDLEWTCVEETLYLLQSRPVTAAGPRGQVPGKLPSLESLEDRGRHIEETILPAMKKEAQALREEDFSLLGDDDMRAHLRYCCERLCHWSRVYDEELVPMAHGIRLFGAYYNDQLRPEDPFEFLALLRGTNMAALRRNRSLSDASASQTGEALLGSSGWLLDGQPLPASLRKMLSAGKSPVSPLSGAGFERWKSHLADIAAESRQRADRYLALGRLSYRLRDDDNLLMGDLRQAVFEAMREVDRRACHSRDGAAQAQVSQECRRLLRFLDSRAAAGPQPGRRYRQLQGHAASEGVAKGPARLIRRGEDLLRVRPGEVLVCDAVDPAMTFVVPLCCAVVERRGGMLVHGAIIAREYAIPCVTGVEDALARIPDGAQVTVDGFLGLVVVDSDVAEREKN